MALYCRESGSRLSPPSATSAIDAATGSVPTRLPRVRWPAESPTAAVWWPFGRWFSLALTGSDAQNAGTSHLQPSCMFRFRKLVAWSLLAQVILVGGLGTGLHDLLGCHHGCQQSCAASCCREVAATECSDCVFCRHAERESSLRVAEKRVNHPEAAANAAGCDGCAVCDLLAQYHCATPFEPAPLAIESAGGHAASLRTDAVIAASMRWFLSRGPPTV